MRNFTEDELKKAVTLAWHHEFDREGNDISSHSQLERWIIQELKKYQFPCRFTTLRRVITELFNIDMLKHIGANIDKQVEDIVSHFAKFGIHHGTTGGGCTAFMMDIENNASIMITLEDGGDAPDDMLEPVVIGVYNSEGNIVDTKHYPNTFALTMSDWFRWLLDV